MGFRAWTAVFVVIAGCGDNVIGEDRQGGDTTVDDRTELAFTHAASNLTEDQRELFQQGTSPFDFHWEIPQLGPQYNNDSCFGCHSSNGRGLAQIGDEGAITDINGPQSESLIRVSLPDADGMPGSPGGPVPLPIQGLQLQDHATVGVSEVIVVLSWDETESTYGDGTPFSLRTPHLDIRTGNGDPLPSDTMFSYRTAPAIIGLGLLQAISEDTLEALADPDDANGDGISGRINQVWDPEQQLTVTGRFGLKANTSTLHLQAAAAAANDIGLSNIVFPETDGTRDVQDDQMAAMAFMVSVVAVPAAAPRDAMAMRGRLRFDDFGCSKCHIPTLVTGDDPIPQIANQTIHPYTDLLIHDMGDGLADNRPDFLASGSEWRTPALWGIGLADVIRDGPTFLHDGRARTFEEAILWHGGEAMTAREAFRTAVKADRDALVAFLATL